MSGEDQHLRTCAKQRLNSESTFFKLEEDFESQIIIDKLQTLCHELNLHYDQMQFSQDPIIKTRPDFCINITDGMDDRLEEDERYHPMDRILIDRWVAKDEARKNNVSNNRSSELTQSELKQTVLKTFEENKHVKMWVTYQYFGLDGGEEEVMVQLTEKANNQFMLQGFSVNDSRNIFEFENVEFMSYGNNNWCIISKALHTDPKFFVEFHTQPKKWYFR